MRRYFQKKTLRDVSRFYIWYLAIFFVLLRVPSLIEPMWYADEGIYTVVAKAMSEGRMLYAEVWDNKPPLLYIFYFLTQNIFGIKLLSIVFGIGAVYLFYQIAKKLFKKEISILISTGMFVFLLGSPFIEGNIANAENFMLLPILGAFFLLLKKNELNIKIGVGSAILFFIALLLKFVAVFDILTWVLFALLREIKQNGKRFQSDYNKSLGAFILTGVVLSIVLLLLLVLLGILPEFIDAVFLKNISYVSEKNTAGVSNSLLIIKIFLLGIFCSVIFFFRKKIQNNFLFIFLWLGFSLFNVYFSERHFGHYLLLLAPVLCLVLGLVMDIAGKMKIFYAAIFVVVLLLVGISFEFFERIGGYYKNYIVFISGKEKIESYQAFFDSTTPRNYEIARIVKNLEANKDILVWSDGGQIYTLLDKAPFGKYIVAYHMIFYNQAHAETKALLAKKKPDVIVEVTKIPSDLDILGDYDEILRVDGVKIYERQ